MKPLDLRLFREVKAARWFIAGAVALAFFSLLATVGLAWQISVVVTELFASGKLLPLTYLAVFAMLRVALIWLNDYLAISAASRIKQDLRNRFLNQIDSTNSGWLAGQSATELALLFGRGLDTLDSYFAKFVPHLFHAAIATPVLVVIAYLVDSTSGIIFTFTLPLIPIFMVFIGWATRVEQKNQLESLTVLSQRFAQVLKGMATLRIFGREKNQEEQLAKSNNAYREKTMRVLRISFLSGFALELAASLSVALVAVAIGFRLVWGEIDLLPGLFILLLAPEVYLPLRNVGASFHASSEGAVSIERIFTLFEKPALEQAAIKPDVRQFESGVSLISGPSGSGKTTLLRAYFEENKKTSSLMAQDLQAWPLSVQENITGPGNRANGRLVQIAVAAAVLDDVSLDYLVAENGTNLSGGQLQRLNLARTIYRFLLIEAESLLLDEPTSAQDDERCRKIIQNLAKLTDKGQLIVISHQDAWRDVAKHVIEVQHA